MSINKPREELREQYEKENDTTFLTSTGDLNLGYVIWLEKQVLDYREVLEKISLNEYEKNSIKE